MNRYFLADLFWYIGIKLYEIELCYKKFKWRIKRIIWYIKGEPTLETDLRRMNEEITRINDSYKQMEKELEQIEKELGVKIMTDFTVEHGKKYKAKIKLSGVEALADDSMVKKILEGFGFTNVVISGFASIRHAEGIWNGDTKTVTLDEHIESVVEEGEEPRKVGMSFTHLEMMKVEPSQFNE